MKFIFLTITAILIVSCAGSHHDVAPAPSPNPPLPELSEPSFTETTTQMTVAPVDNHCPAGMQHVEGDFCPSVDQRCLRWIDAKQTVCAEFSPSTCLSKSRVHKNFCIDTYEYPNIKGTLPAVMISWNEAKNKCEKEGKRLCQYVEWTFACEGEDMRPYPYGDGLHRDANACSIDKPWINPFVYGDPNDRSKVTGMRPLVDVDQRVASGSYEACVSPYGVHDMTGNVDESVVNPQGKPFHSGEQGGHWAKGARNRCRPMTIAHNETFRFYEIGARCCANSN